MNINMDNLDINLDINKDNINMDINMGINTDKVSYLSFSLW